ncbi:DUF1697 domain-containing protein [uncultured Muriicola sp.]|uniref:DUF1697 domain-containing protein n=1 Tax=uncultured Muriicola sp. TaxID=1583102 RepID=UPI002616A5C7|nr:DUF1697 domain-containing protein [uncultured Muriicola sp.]
MNAAKELKTYIAFLRGINVGGHHKVPMAELQQELEALSFQNVTTLLNSGNVIFEVKSSEETELSNRIAQRLEKVFQFPVPTIVINADSILELLNDDPFKGEVLSRESRGYVSFLQYKPKTSLQLPWISEDNSLKILRANDKFICSFLDLSKVKTPVAMNALEKLYGKQMTTRNWNTIMRIGVKLEAQ